jgi:hypothetical protein
LFPLYITSGQPQQKTPPSKTLVFLSWAVA